MQNFAMIETKMNNGMDDDWTQNGQEQTQMQLANKKIIKQKKQKKM